MEKSMYVICQIKDLRYDYNEKCMGTNTLRKIMG